MSEKSRESWEDMEARMNSRVEIIDEINRELRRKDVGELEEIRDELKFEGEENHG